MRYLGIDYGEKRIGLALSDEKGHIAFPYRTMPNVKTLFNDITGIAKKEGVEKIVVGLPIPFSGGESRQALEIKKFAERLKKELSVPIEFENEVLTTKMAERSSVSRKHLDQSAAAIILQSHLDKLKAKH